MKQKRIPKILLVLLGLLLLLVLTYYLGPRPPALVLDSEIKPMAMDIAALDAYVDQKEAKHPVRPKNEADIIWADSAGAKTAWSIVYLHGYSASRREGQPLHEEMAKKYGCNLYLSRLHAHGLDVESPLEDMDMVAYFNSAKEAVNIGKTLGDKVCVISCSTGSTLALYLASHNPEWIDALICYSPNIAVKDPRAALLAGPWADLLAKASLGGEYYHWDGNAETQEYWYTRYHYDALIGLQQFLNKTMVEETFEAIEQPIFVGYYYKNETEQDQVVSVAAIQDMIPSLGTEKEMVDVVVFDDAAGHVICSDNNNPALASVINETEEFVEEVLNWKEVRTYEVDTTKSMQK